MRSNMDGPKLSPSEVREEISCDFLYMWNLERNDKINCFTKQAFTDLENELMLARG